MKTHTNQSQLKWILSGSLPLIGLLFLAAAQALAADGGRGSIRAAGRGPAPAARSEPPRVEARPEVRPQPQVREAPRPEVRPEVRPEARPAPPRVVAPARGEWDARDEDARHFGGYARPEPARVHWGTRIRALPDHHFDRVFHDRHYFWDPTGIYYVQDPDGEYDAVEPPIGFDIDTLPDGAVSIQVGPTTFYYLDGVFYVAQGDGYVVVTPPAGVVVPDLPDGANQVVINNAVVFQFNGLNYTPTLQDGVTAYLVTPS